MVNKALLYGIIGFILGGLVVSSAFALSDKKTHNSQVSNTSTVEHNKVATDQLMVLEGDAFDKAFVAEMINHHHGAIDMAKLTATNAKHDEIKKLGQDIMNTQSKEIDMMQTWQEDWGYGSMTKFHDAHNM